MRVWIQNIMYSFSSAAGSGRAKTSPVRLNSGSIPPPEASFPQLDPLCFQQLTGSFWRSFASVNRFIFNSLRARPTRETHSFSTVYAIHRRQLAHFQSFTRFSSDPISFRTIKAAILFITKLLSKGNRCSEREQNRLAGI